MRADHHIKRIRRHLTGARLLLLGLIGFIAPHFLHAAGVSGGDADVDHRRIGAKLSIHDMITDITVESLERRIQQAKKLGASVIIFDMDTPGGLVSSSIAIADLIRELTDIKTVAWVNPNAHSGGSLVAVSCDEIVMSRSSRIGDSEVIMGGPGGAGAVPKELKAKAFTPVISDFRQSAKLNGYSEVLCEAFVFPDREVWWIENVDTGERRFVFRDEKLRLVDGKDEDVTKEAGEEKDAEKLSAMIGAYVDKAAKEEQSNKDETAGPPTDQADARDTGNPGGASPRWRLVTSYHDPLSDSDMNLTQPIVRDDLLLEMSAGEASAYGFCKAIISDEAGLLKRYDLASITPLDPTWSEEFAFWMTSLYVRGFLMVIVLLGAYVEFHTPGVGVPGLVALIALAVFVGAPYLSGLATVWEILAIVIGFVLIALEVFVIPGFGMAGISGAILLLVGLLGTFVPDEPGRPFPFYLPSLPSTIEWFKQGMIAMTGAMAVSLAGMVVLSRYLPRTMMFRRIAPPNPTPSDVMVDDEYLGVARIGDMGLSEGPLHPAGKARFGVTLVDVVTQGEYLERGQRIEVIEHRGNKVVVRAAT